MWLTRQLKQLRWFFISPLFTQLTQFQRRIETLANEQEARLDNALSELKQEIGKAQDRVIDKIEQIQRDNPNLSDELESVLAMTRQVKEIVASPPPVEETGQTGTETGTGEAVAS